MKLSSSPLDVFVYLTDILWVGVDESSNLKSCLLGYMPNNNNNKAKKANNFPLRRPNNSKHDSSREKKKKKKSEFCTVNMIHIMTNQNFSKLDLYSETPENKRSYYLPFLIYMYSLHMYYYCPGSEIFVKNWHYLLSERLWGNNNNKIPIIWKWESMILHQFKLIEGFGSKRGAFKNWSLPFLWHFCDSSFAKPAFVFFFVCLPLSIWR